MRGNDVSDHWVLERFRAVDRKDIDGFIDMLTDDHRFLFGSRPPVIGKVEAREQVLHFWSLIGRLRHNVRRVTEAGEFVFVEADVDASTRRSMSLDLAAERPVRSAAASVVRASTYGCAAPREW